MKKLTLIYKSIVLLTTIGIIVILFSTFNPSAKVTDDPPIKLPPRVPKITLESIFQKQNDTSDLDPSYIITLIATGDVIPARGANWPAVTGGDFTYNWKKTADFLKKGDLTLINLETPLTKNCPLQTEGMNFCGDARHIKGIIFAGVNTVAIANNHIGNYAQSGINETKALLDANKIGWGGFGNLDIQEVKGTKFGFLAFNGIGVSINQEALAKEIKTAKPKVDVLVVSIHWGDEYVLVPRKYGNIAPDDPIQIGHLIIDSGADLVIGNHPHWVQGIELYQDKLITYAHGNFIFDQTWSKETQEGVVGEYTFYLSSEDSVKEGISEPRVQAFEAKLVNVKFHPILVDVSYQPRFLSVKEGQHILDRMIKSSKQIAEK